DFVIASGKNHSVRTLCELAFGLVGLDYHDHVVVDESNLRPSDVAELLGDSSKARSILGWRPTVDFEALIQMMVEADVARLRADPATQGSK
ncbi:MAG: GDP-mannose 4,6-dehydratase, partial [Candidatus Limnocylindria bacterium]